MKKNQHFEWTRSAADQVDREALRNTMTALIAEAHAQQGRGPTHRRTEQSQKDRAHIPSRWSPMLPDNLQSLLFEPPSQRSMGDLVLNEEVRRDIRQFIQEFSETALLRSHSLEPRHTILLVGPPGTGKTSLASALAQTLGLPFLVVRYDGLVGSYLGETASRLQQIVDYIARTPCVLFFDEFESIGKERADIHETGEIKRVVSSLLLHMDSLPTHCVVVCATNHPELLDRAVWRRFELRIELPLPQEAELREWFERTVHSFGGIGLTAAEFSRLLAGESFSEIETITLDARRKAVLSKGELTSAAAFKEALESWRRRRLVGGELKYGAGANRKNKSRARNQQKGSGEEALLSEFDLLSRAKPETRR